MTPRAALRIATVLLLLGPAASAHAADAPPGQTASAPDQAGTPQPSALQLIDRLLEQYCATFSGARFDPDLGTCVAIVRPPTVREIITVPYP